MVLAAISSKRRIETGPNATPHSSRPLSPAFDGCRLPSSAAKNKPQHGTSQLLYVPIVQIVSTTFYAA